MSVPNYQHYYILNSKSIYILLVEQQISKTVNQLHWTHVSEYLTFITSRSCVLQHSTTWVNNFLVWVSFIWYHVSVICIMFKVMYLDHNAVVPSRMQPLEVLLECMALNRSEVLRYCDDIFLWRPDASLSELRAETCSIASSVHTGMIICTICVTKYLSLFTAPPWTWLSSRLARHTRIAVLLQKTVLNQTRLVSYAPTGWCFPKIACQPQNSALYRRMAVSLKTYRFNWYIVKW